MVQSTGTANAEYLRSITLENKRTREANGDDSQPLEGQRKWQASSRWAAAAQFALAVSLTSSHNDLQSLEIEDDNSILKKTKDAVVTLRSVLEGKHDKEIEDSLNQSDISRERWWPSLYKMVEGNVILKISDTSIRHKELLKFLDLIICVYTLRACRDEQIGEEQNATPGLQFRREIV